MTALEDRRSVVVAIPFKGKREALQAARPSETLTILQGQTMGTSWSARFFALPERSVSIYRNAIEQELLTVVSQMSHWAPDSELSKLNRSPADCWHSLPAEFLQVLAFALQVAAQTSGAFDPTIGRLVDEWGFGPQGEKRTLPSPEVLSDLRCSCGWMRIELDRAGHRVRHAGDPSLDFSGVAKGFAVDRVARALELLGIRSYLVEIGGELRARGSKHDHQPWWISIEPPGEAAASTFPEIRIALTGWSVATSGDYRRFFEKHGKSWSHTIDPRTGYPLGSDVAQVSVMHESCMAADAYSTALMVLGAKEGLDLAQRLGLAAVFVLRSPVSLEVRCTDQFFRMTEEA